MDATTNFVVSGMAGAPVDVIVYNEGNTRLLKTHVHTAAPLKLKIDGNGYDIAPARRVTLLAKHDGMMLRADGHLQRARKDETGWYLDISQVHWELLERRRYPRMPVSIPVSLRIVSDDDDELRLCPADGTTLDMSISGAFILMSEPPPQGCLIEFRALLDGEPVRALAVVAHVAPDRGGIGLHFVEYIGSAQAIIHGYLAKSAA